MAARVTGRWPLLETVIEVEAGLGVPACSIVNAAVFGLTEMRPGEENHARTSRFWSIVTTQVAFVVQVKPVPEPNHDSQAKSGFNDDATNVTGVPQGYDALHWPSM